MVFGGSDIWIGFCIVCKVGGWKKKGGFLWEENLEVKRRMMMEKGCSFFGIKEIRMKIENIKIISEDKE